MQREVKIMKLAEYRLEQAGLSQVSPKVVTAGARRTSLAITNIQHVACEI